MNHSSIRSRVVRVALLVLLSAFMLVAGAWAQAAPKTTRVSVSSTEAEGDGGSDRPAVSATGRFVAFESRASNLVGGDTNGASDIFVRDRRRGMTRRVSVSSPGVEANGNSYGPGVSATGRFVVFESLASNLVAGDTNDATDVFLRDRTTRTTTRVSVSSAGAQGDGGSFFAAISADGRFVAFVSLASNLVADDTNGARDIFVRDRRTRTTTRVSVSAAGGEANGHSSFRPPSLSANGRFIAFESSASNLVADDTNGAPDIFVRDRTIRATTRASVSSVEAEGNAPSNRPELSASGRFVAFESDASNLVAGDSNARRDIFVRDRRTGQTTRVSVTSAGGQGHAGSLFAAISADGRFVAFDSAASNLVPYDENGATDIFLRDRRRGTTRRVSVSSAGAESNSLSFDPAISADGRFVGFVSAATNLVARDERGAWDVFVRGPLRRR
jgi:Tol biopolymer transport system component